MKYRNRSRKGVIAMKLDIIKAYDKVEWGFLCKLLLTLGFHGRWVNLFMDCVSSISYSLIINGGVCGSVTPDRGLSQGGPFVSLSFYSDCRCFFEHDSEESLGETDSWS